MTTRQKEKTCTSSVTHSALVSQTQARLNNLAALSHLHREMHSRLLCQMESIRHREACLTLRQWPIQHLEVMKFTETNSQSSFLRVNAKKYQLSKSKTRCKKGWYNVSRSSKKSKKITKISKTLAEPNKTSIKS